MKQTITICKQKDSKTLTVIGEKRLNLEFNESEMEVYVKYNRKLYKVEGNIYMSYIVIE